MSSPYPSRRSLIDQGRTDEPSEVKARAESEAKEEPGSGTTSDRKTASKKARRLRERYRRRWTWGLAIGGALLFFSLLAVGFLAYTTSEPPVRGVPGVLDTVQVSGKRGRPPVVTLERDVEVASVKARVERAGQGRPLEEGDPVLLAITAFDGSSGQNLNVGGEPNVILTSLHEANLGATLSSLLIDKTEGTRLVVARPLDDGTTEVNVVDVLPTVADGEPCNVTWGADSAPLAVGYESGQPTVTYDTADPPTELVIQCVLEGTGRQIGPEDQIVVQYMVGKWSDRSVLTSTWIEGVPTIARMSDLMPGIAHALVDQRVGTRLALSIPPDMGTGEDTLFAVVDVLALLPANEAQ